MAGINLNWGLVNNLWFSDDIGLLTRNGIELQETVTQTDKTSRRFLSLIIADTNKRMAIENLREMPINISSKGELIKQVNQLVYLQDLITKVGKAPAIAKSQKKFKWMQPACIRRLAGYTEKQRNNKSKQRNEHMRRWYTFLRWSEYKIIRKHDNNPQQKWAGYRKWHES